MQSHEPAGTIIALGPQAEAEGKWKVGDRVGILLFRHACKHCAGCEVTGDIRFCENGDFAGLKGDGGMAEYAIGDAVNMCRIPDQIGFVQGAPLMCAGVSPLFLPFCPESGCEMLIVRYIDRPLSGLGSKQPRFNPASP